MKDNMRNKVQDYFDYASIHGIGRLKKTPYVLLKVLWGLAILLAITVIGLQIHELLYKWQMNPVSTTLTLNTPKTTRFPKVIFCNTNPLRLSNIPTKSPVARFIDDTAQRYDIDIGTIVGDADNVSQRFDNMDDTGKLGVEDNILRKSSTKFKLAMSVTSTKKLLKMSQTRDDFIIVCSFGGETCNKSSLSHIRTYDYGMCFEFHPNQGANSDMVAATGPDYGLELLLNLNQTDSVPFVTSTAEVMLAVCDSDTQYVNPKLFGISAPVGFETKIAVTRRYESRLTDTDNCNDWPYRYSFSSCRDNCIENDIQEHCNCTRQAGQTAELLKDSVPLNETRDHSGLYPCHTTHDYNCVIWREQIHLREIPEQCRMCKPPCKEMVYKLSPSMSTWPGQTFVPILKKVLKRSRLGLNESVITQEFIQENFLMVRIYLSSLSYETVEEYRSYSAVNFISDVGGQLGLWAGLSVLSFVELLELVLLLFVGMGCWHRNRVKDLDAKETKEKDKSMTD